MAKDVSELNDKQRRFIREYVIDLNQTKAAIRSGYSPRSAKNHAVRMMAHATIKSEIQKLLTAKDQQIAKLVDKGIDDKARWLDEVRALAYSDITEAFTVSAEGKVTMTIAELKKSGFGRMIRKLKVKPNGTVEFDMHAKIPALELLGKAYGYVTEEVNLAATIKNVTTLDESDFKRIFSSPEVAEQALKLADMMSPPLHKKAESPLEKEPKS